VVGTASAEIASVAWGLSLVPLPPVFRRTSDAAPAASVTGRSKFSVAAAAVLIIGWGLLHRGNRTCQTV
jgi:hypothetical protein